MVICCWALCLSATAQEVGVASYYHAYFNGKKTASGEIYDDRKLTAAHKTLPMGTLIKVTNLENDRTVVVRVNDRGPYVRNRILDLTKAAAVQLGFIQNGSARVSIELFNGDNTALGDTASTIMPDGKFYTINEVDTTTKLTYGIKLGSYEDAKYVFSISRELKTRYSAPVYIQTVKLIKGNLYRIFVGNYASAEDASSLHTSLKKLYPESRVVKYDSFK